MKPGGICSAISSRLLSISVLTSAAAKAAAKTAAKAAAEAAAKAAGAAAIGVLALAGAGVPAHAQAVTSRPVVQPLPSQDTQRLNRALVELAKSPRSVSALLEAGNAALAVGDLDAALGFFKRLTDLEPQNERGVLGLARVYLRSGRPVRALLYFDAAQSRGAEPLALGSDQALTYDLLGDQPAAQAAYLRLIEASPKDEEARRRLALSYAISGDEAAFETTLRPLIERRDFAAFRTRTFGLAIMGKTERAAAIAEAVMPRVLAGKIVPFLEFMPRLTPAQQAAAANLGVFPRAADIGRDAPDVLAYQKNMGGRGPGAPPRTPAALPDSGSDSTGARLTPTGTPLGANAPADERSATGPQGLAGVTVLEEESADDGAATGPGSEPQPETLSGSPPQSAAHPSRIWVQVATGSDLEALRFDWRRLTRKAPDALSRYIPHAVAWGQTNRLLAGPLESLQEARDLINALNRKGVESFRYTSPKGTEIQKVGTL